jgi:hypothetical protein
MRQQAERTPTTSQASALAAPHDVSLGALARRLAVAGGLLAALTVLASIVLAA